MNEPNGPWGPLLRIVLAMLLSTLATVVLAASVTYEYDGAGRLHKVVHADAGVAVEYRLDSAGNRTSVVAGVLPVVTQFTATVNTASKITLAWAATETNGPPGALTYAIKRGTTTLSQCTASPCADTGLSPATAYTYTLTVTDSAGVSTSASATATTYSLPVISASASTASATAINLSWTASDAGGPGISNYNVYRGGTLLTPTPITATSFQDTGLSPGASYTYTVTAYDSAGDSASATASASTYPLPTVSGSGATINSTQVQIIWTASDTGGPGLALGYRVYRGSTLLTPTPITAPAYVDTGLSPGTTYTYTVVAYDTVGDAGSGTITVATYPLPSVSGGVLATSDTGISLAWSASDAGGPGIANYNVWRGSTLLTPSRTTDTSYADYGLAPNTTYTYTITAYDTVDDAGTTTITATTAGPPVLTLSVSNVTPSTVTLQWNVSGYMAYSVNNYMVYRGSTLLTPSGTTNLSFQDTGLAPATTYTYTVQAFSALGFWGSNTTSATTQVDPNPTFIQITDATTGNVIPAAAGLYAASTSCTPGAPCIWTLRQTYGAQTTVGQLVKVGTSCLTYSGGPLVAGYRRIAGTCRFEADSNTYGH